MEVMHRNGSDGNLSPVEEDEMHCSDGYNSEEEVSSQSTTQVTSGQFQDILARIKAQQAQDNSFANESGAKSTDDDEMDDLKADEQNQREVLLAMQRHALQMAAAAGSGLPNAAHIANLAALGGFGSQFNAMSLFANSAFSAATGGTGGGAGAAGANLSPPMGSMASQNSSNQMTPTAINNNGSLATLEAGKGYTFEEQFKQLYEISEDPKRKAFLDDLFTFMQRRGSPINRIPIMAKQVLDLYELYNLVVARGGLVEVINKKIWREITKGLNLPSSITSAAFTLRTQYMKYLYPYECEKENLSSADELQMAIDGNRREGRRSSYGAYPDMGGSPPPSLAPPVAAILGSGSNNHPAASALTSMDLFSRTGLDLTSTLSLMSRQLNGHGHQNNVSHSSDDDREDSISPPVIKGERSSSPLDEPVNKRFKNHDLSPQDGLGFSGMNIKMNSKDGRPLDGQITMSIEVNGVLYNGILFAQSKNK